MALPVNNAQGIGNCGAPGGNRCHYLSGAVNAEGYEHSDIALGIVLANTTGLFFRTRWVKLK